MLSTVKLSLAAALFGTLAIAQACDPLNGTCPPDLGLDTGSYYIDFTQQSPTTTPANWTLAADETVTYGANGAEFTFDKRYDAPYLWTDFNILFGTVEVVMQAAPGVGMISSIVLLSDDADEIDWEFSGNNFGTASGLAQTNYFGKGITGAYDRGTQVPVTSPQNVFHTYTLDWSPTALTWSVDGNVVRILTNNGATTGDYQYPQTPMQLHLGLWDGGDADTAAGTVEWAGGHTDLSKVPFTMFVKSVKITNTNPCASYSYSDTSGNAGSIKCGALDPSANSTAAPSPLQTNQVVGGESNSTSVMSINSSLLNNTSSTNTLTITSTVSAFAVSTVTVTVDGSLECAAPTAMASSTDAAFPSAIPTPSPPFPMSNSTVPTNASSIANGTITVTSSCNDNTLTVPVVSATYAANGTTAPVVSVTSNTSMSATLSVMPTFTGAANRLIPFQGLKTVWGTLFG